MDLNLILGLSLMAVVFFYLIQALAKPLTKLLLRSSVAAFGIWAVNVLGSLLGFHVGLNIVTAFLVGALGLPGVGLILAVKYLL